MRYGLRIMALAALFCCALGATAQQYIFNFHKHFVLDGFTNDYEMLSSESEHIIGTISVSPKGEGTIKLIQGGSSTTWNVESRSPDARNGSRVYKVSRAGNEATATLAAGGVYLTIVGEDFKDVYSRTDIVPEDEEEDQTSSSITTSLQKKEEEAFVIVEEMPEFPGGKKALQEYLSEHCEYPEEAEDEGIEGTVYVNFVVEKDGSISNVKIVRGIGGGCDEEAMRVVKNMPSWIPGKQRGKLVRVNYNLPIRFAL